jgi:hypothetical protein
MKNLSAEFQILRTSMQHLMRKEGYRKYWPTFINKLSDHDTDVLWQTCVNLLHVQLWLLGMNRTLNVENYPTF